MTPPGGVHYRSDEEVEEVVRRFEACRYTPDEFNHGPHLTVALCYLLRLPEPEACALMRRGIRRFLEHHRLGHGVYHETLTVFWVKRVGAFAGRAGPPRALAALANELLEECGDSRLVYSYYSRERIESDEAREGWVGPDLRPLDF